MDGLTCGTLAEIVRGRLVLGTMPPLGGPYEPIRGVVFTSADVARGDVFWELHSPDGTRPINGVAEEAFVRGAVGVVSSGRKIEPWAGSCAIRLGNVAVGLERLAAWTIRRTRCRRVLVLDDGQALIAHLLQLIASRDGVLSGICRSAEEVAMRTILGGLNADWDVLGVDAGVDDHLCRISDLCAPQVTVITAAANGRMDLPSLISALPKNGQLLIANDESSWTHLDLATSQTIGSGDETRILSVRPSDDRLVLVVDGERYAIQTDRCLPLSDLGIVMTAARAMGFDTEQVIAACERLLQSRSESKAEMDMRKTCKVPPLVSGLRESDAALPPGLKRWAC
jgi:hypothetical protein